MPLLVRVVDVLVLLRLVVLPGVVVDDAPGVVDAVGGDANGEGVVGRQCVALRCRWRWFCRVYCVLLLLLPPVGGLVGGAGGVCPPALLASLVAPTVTAPWHVVGGVGAGVDSAVGVGDAGVADGEGVIGAFWWSGGVGVVGVGAGRGLRFGGGRFRVCHPWLVVGPLVVLVVPVVSGVGVFLSAVLGSVVAGVAPVVVGGVNAVGGSRCRCVAAVGGAGDGVGEGAAS